MRRVLVRVVVSYFEVKDMEVAVHNLSLRHHYLKLDNLKHITQFLNAKHVLNHIIFTAATHELSTRQLPSYLYLCGLLARATELVSVYTVPF